MFFFSIPACGYFFTLMVPMFQQRGYPAPLALGTLNQFAEIIFMFSMPWFVSKLGLKRVLLIGMTAWAVRYLCFSSPSPTFSFPLALLGLVLHGFCYSFFYVGAYMWVDRRAPAELKSSAQSLLAFLLLGVGFLLGAKGAGFMMEEFPAKIPHMPTYTVVEVADAKKADEAEEADKADEADKVEIPNRVLVKRTKGTEESETLLSLDNGIAELQQIKSSLPRWDDPKAKDTAWRFLDLSATVAGMLQSPQEKAKATEESQVAMLERLDTDGDGEISRKEIEAVPEEGIVIEAAGDDAGKLTYSKQELTARFDGIRESILLADVDSVPWSYWLASALDLDLLSQLDTDADGEGKGKISLAEVEAVDESGVHVGGVTYTRDDLIGTFQEAQEALGLTADAVLDRDQWLAVQSNNWWHIWIWPSLCCFVLLAIFALAFRDKPPEQEKKK